MPVPQIFDFIVLILVGWLTLRGMMRGIVAQVMSIVSVIVCWGIAVKFSPVVAPMVSDEPPWNRLIAMFILFIACYFAFWLIRGLMNDIIKAIRLKSADRSLGALLGFTKGILLCLILTLFLVVFSENTRNFTLDSISGKYFARGIERISIMIPEDMSEVLSRNLERFHGSFKEKLDAVPKPLVNQVQENFAGVLSLKDIETQPTPTPSPLREKIASTPAMLEPPAPTAQPQRAVLPFQPNR